MLKKTTTKRGLLGVLLLLLGSINLFGQAGSGEIYGTVSDDQGGLPGARITVTQGGIVFSQKVTDLNGNYSIKPVPSGEYEVEAFFTGLGSKKVTIFLTTDGKSKNDFVLGTNEDEIVDTSIGAAQVFSKKLLSDDPGVDVIGSKEINTQASRATDQFANLAANVVTSKAGDNSGVSVGGGRNEGTTYMIDGVIVRGSRNVNLPIGSIASVEVMGSGLPAKYGDATGGVIALTTKGITSKFAGGLYFERSVEGYGHNQVSLNMSGPLYSRFDSTIDRKRPVAGFFVALDYIDNKDGNPNFYKNATVKEDKIKWLEQNPLTQAVNGSGTFQNNSDFLTDEDITYVKYRQDARSRAAQLVSKLDFMPSIQTNLTLGFQLNYSQYNSWSRANSLLTPSSNPLFTNYSGRTYFRFTHRVPDDPEVLKKISNVYYTGQFSYQKDFLGSESPYHKKDFFRYGHLGTYTEDIQPIYSALESDSATGLVGYKLVGYGSRGLNYQRAEDNPVLSNYTDFAYANGGPTSLANLFALGGLRNGDGPGSVYGIYTGVGAQYTGYTRNQADQISLNLESGFTINGKDKDLSHNMEVGFYYEQRTDRSYSLGSQGLWNLMRLSTNRHISNLDLANPIFKVGGKEYTYDDFQNGSIPWTSLDTIYYNRRYVAEDQSFFDKNLREKLGLAANGTDYIQVDALDPSTFSLDMFSADDLFNQSQSYVSMYGFDHLGNVLKGKVSYNDFFLDKDQYGNFSRKTASFQPIYMAGYIMDKFRFQEIDFQIGLRFDRYDANTKVLRDPYSLYGIRHVSDLQSGSYRTYNNVGIPDNIKGDFVPYVGDNESSKPTIAGYRNGDKWYDPYGREVDDPKTLQDNYTGASNNLQPYLTNKDDDFKEANVDMLNRSLTDYKPQLTASPRIQLSFPVNEKSLIYAHYDVIVQRPKGTNTTGVTNGNINYFNPYNYYFFTELSSNWFGNPNLKPARTYQYEVGFQQVLSEENRSVLTLSTYYTERKDMIQVRPYFYAYPKQYNAFGNRDFASTKGLKLKFNTNIGKKSYISANYVYSLNEGTGSSTTSQFTLIQSGQGSLRPTSFFLNNDVRHNIKVNAYTVFQLDDPTGFFRKFINGFDLNVFANLRSGTPYTRYARPVPIVGAAQGGNPIVGTINGSRLPWTTQLDLKTSKNFVLRESSAATETSPAKKAIVINVFCYVQNILNKRNLLEVYKYTGNPDNDGYLSSSIGQQAISQFQLAQQQSYIDIYNIALYNNPRFFNTPRRITVGLNYNF